MVGEGKIMRRIKRRKRGSKKESVVENKEKKKRVEPNGNKEKEIMVGENKE